MGKYCGCMTVNDRCKSEIAELRDVLERYNVDKADVEIIEDMIIEPYYELNKCFASGRALQRIIEEVMGSEEAEKERFRKYLVYMQEESEKYPFTVKEDSDEI